MAAAGLKPEYEVKQTKTNDFCFEILKSQAGSPLRELLLR